MLKKAIQYHFILSLNIACLLEHVFKLNWKFGKETLLKDAKDFVSHSKKGINIFYGDVAILITSDFYTLLHFTASK